MLRNLGLPSLIGYLVQTPEYRNPQFTALTTSVYSAPIKNLQHPSTTYSRICDLLNKPNVRLGQVQLGFNTITTTKTAWASKGSKLINCAQISSVTTRVQHAAKHISPRCYSDNHMNHNKFFAFGSSPETLACSLVVCRCGSALSCTCHPLSDTTVHLVVHKRRSIIPHSGVCSFAEDCSESSNLLESSSPGY